jgi:asparagine synthase (glutamine-hydrolysing)
MCGIAGLLGGPNADAETVTAMTRALIHRGPDDEGIWVDREAGIGLGQRRLSIIDLSPAGHQPMHSPAGRYVITLNGEIYNYHDLRAELSAESHCVNWRGHSDTEVLLAAFDYWGIKPTLQRANGMFALALWDRQERSLTLARDRLGEKPLYYASQLPGGPFLFGSELKALLQYPGFEPEIDRDALGLLLRYLAIPAPRSIYRGVAKLLPGTLLTVRDGVEPIIDAYWSGAEIARAGAANPIDDNPQVAANELERVLEHAVGRQMMSDVPLGAFLSGGVDSSTVVAIMQKLSARPVKTFTIGFHDKAFDEAEHAAAVARHLGTDHTELYVSPGQAMDVIPKLPAMYDEPFADSSQIPTHLISALARTEVTVALSGDGGDELFGGYDRHLFAAGLWPKIERVPQPLRAAAGRALRMVPAAAWTNIGAAAGGLLPWAMKVRRLGEKVHKAAPVLSTASLDQFYADVITTWPLDESPVIGANVPPFDVTELNSLGGVERMMVRDMLGYLPNDVLAKVDRAAMAVSLETRVPLLDRDVVEFAWRVPLGLKIRGGVSKWLLRQVLYRHVPKNLIERPKTGFSIPLDEWLRGPLRDWAEGLLSERRLREDGFLDSRPIRKAWEGQLRGQANSAKLWTVLMFESWLGEQAQGAAKHDHRTAVAS